MAYVSRYSYMQIPRKRIVHYVISFARKEALPKIRGVLVAHVASILHLIGIIYCLKLTLQQQGKT